jgi:hypothetical protein
MKANTLTRLAVATLIATGIATTVFAQSPKMKMTTDIPQQITTPDKVETSIGTLKFFDGVPTQESVQTLYDNLDRIRGVQAFLAGLPAASTFALYEGPKAIGADRPNKIQIWQKLMDSKTLLLTGNTSTLYSFTTLDLKTDGATVIELPPGMLGAIDSAWFRYVGDFGPAGQDKGKGGKFVVVPPDYKGTVPDGYFVLKSPTYRNWIFLRGSIAKGVDAAVQNIEENLRIYPLAMADNPPKTEFVKATGKVMNTLPANDFSFFEQLNAVVQYEPIESLDPQTRGLFASIGIIKGQPFKPDQRMKELLTDAVAIGNGTARAITFYPRTPGNYIYGEDSGWIMGFANKNTSFTYDGAYNTEAATWFYYNAIGVTPAMAVTRAGAGSDYGIIATDTKKQALDGAKTYKLTLPPNVPVKNFWAVTVYDTQTRSQLQTDQPYPTIGSQTKGIQKNANGSFEVYFAPKAPKGEENNWLQTIPGKSWIAVLRMYGPEEAWIKQTWRPGEIELVK